LFDVITGEYFIEVTYFGQQIPGSPFVSKAWDISKVTVSDLRAGRVGYESTFKSRWLLVIHFSKH